MLSTKHSAEFATIIKKGKPVTKPKVVFEYNKAKAAVDMSDQMSSYSSPLRKTVKWYRKLAIELVMNIAMVNAFVMYRETTKKSMSIVEFRRLLVLYLTNTVNEEVVNKKPKRLKHELLKKEGKVRLSRRFCASCYKDCVKIWGSKIAKNKCPKVNTYCNQCVKYLCLK